MIWDDHDIYDGWGSYPAHMQNCSVFQGLRSLPKSIPCTNAAMTIRRLFLAVMLHLACTAVLTPLTPAPFSQAYIVQRGASTCSSR